MVTALKGLNNTDPHAGEVFPEPGRTFGAVPTYDRREAAHLLGVSVDWMREHHSELPHLRMGRLIRFTDAHLAETQRAREVRPAPQPVTDGIRRRRRMPVDWRTSP